jgi:hypothetical protein
VHPARETTEIMTSRNAEVDTRDTDTSLENHD